MKILMTDHYHGILSEGQHLNAGEEHDLPKEAAEELINRGKAEAVKAKTRAAKAMDKTAEEMKEAKAEAKK